VGKNISNLLSECGFLLCNTMKNKTQRRKKNSSSIAIMALCSVALLLPMGVNVAHAGFISCPDNVDFEMYPICEYETQWNASERFNELVVQKISNMTTQINSREIYVDNTHAGTEDIDQMKWAYLSGVFAIATQQVKIENPGLFEMGERIKDEIYLALDNNN